MEKWFALLNPYARSGKARRKEAAVRRCLAQAHLEYELVVSESRHHACQLIAGALDEGYRKFIAVGGDGSFNCLVNGIFRQHGVPPDQVTLALIPLGTGNDWIKTHHIPHSIKQAVEAIRAGKTQWHDVGVLVNRHGGSGEKRYFINEAGAAFQGFVAERIEGTAHWLKVGGMAFYFGILDALFRYKITEMKVQLDQECFEGQLFSVSIGICRFAGGGMKLTPDAVADDGLFNITLVHRLSKWEVIKNVLRLFDGSFVRHPRITTHVAKGVMLTSNPAVPLETDGEILGYGDAVVELMPQAIRVVVA